MKRFEVIITVTETRYYIVDADDEDDAITKAEASEPSFVKEHEFEAEAREGEA